MQIDQDINCRTVGRCTYGAPIDREMGDMIPVDNNGKILSLNSDASRHFTYVRYNPDLSPQGLFDLKLPHIESSNVREMDSTKHMSQLREVGRAAGKTQIKIKEHFPHFLREPIT